MADAAKLRSTFRLLLLLTVVVLVAVGNKLDESSLALNNSTTARSTNDTSGLTGTREKSSENFRKAESSEEQDSSWEMDDGDEEDEEDPESDSEPDEYEDELKEIAESHEAMSRDERTNDKSGMPPVTNHEKNIANFSRENFDSGEGKNIVASNGTLIVDKTSVNTDEEVAELLRYRQKGNPLLGPEKAIADSSPKLGTKVKRVPTVKKELSTQKEILNANETEFSIPKMFIANQEVVNRLDEDIRPEATFGLPVNTKNPNRFELVRDDTSLDENYADPGSPSDLLRKLDKRQPSEPNELGSRFLNGYLTEEQLRKLQELGVEEGELAKSLVEQLRRLAEIPRLRERVHRILADVVGVPYIDENSLDSQKRANSPFALQETTVATAYDSESSTKPAKKRRKKKKKKKLRSRSTTARTETAPTITSTALPYALTTETNVPSPTQAQWRLVAERLFGNSWSGNRAAIGSQNRAEISANSMTDRFETIDEKERLKALNDERQALMLQSAREYSQPRRLHFGKINTHEKTSAHGDKSPSKDEVKNYDSSNEESIDYDSEPRSFRPIDRYDRYGHYGRERIRDYGLEQDADYEDIYRNPGEGRRPFGRTQFGTYGRDFEPKSWQESRYEYPRIWKEKGRTDDVTGWSDWQERNSPRDYKIWVPRYQPRERNYWQRYGNVEDRLDEIMNEDENELPRHRSRDDDGIFRSHDSRWQIERNLDVPSWQIHGPKSHDREISTQGKSKNFSEFENKENLPKNLIKEKASLPKITMKTWNSLTSDPATWPFKLTGAKPWPKDKNGNSYNPNAELVRKLGLDKQQDRTVQPLKTENRVGTSREILPQDSSAYKSENSQSKGTDVGIANSGKSWPDKLTDWRGDSRREVKESSQMWPNSEERKVWGNPGKSAISPKISSVGAWVMPADQSTWRPYDLKHKIYGQVPEERRTHWNEQPSPDDSESRSWPTKSVSWPQKSGNEWNVIGYGSEKSPPGVQSPTWPSKWRQFAYHKVTAAPTLKSGSVSVVDGSRPRNSYIAVSAVSPPKYSSNDWRKNDIEETQLATNQAARFDQDDPSSQLRKNSNIAKNRWDKPTNFNHEKSNDLENDPLEHQLEELRQGSYWNHDQLRQQIHKRSSDNNSSIVAEGTETSPSSAKSSHMDNEILKNHVDTTTVVETETQGTKNVTK